MNHFFTSDQHFGHANIIKYSARPFSSVEEMNEEMVRRYNEVVKDDDVVWHLGDFSMNDRALNEYLPRLRGKKVLIAGNHDGCHPCHSQGKRRERLYIRAGFLKIYERTKTHFDGLGLVLLCHMPLRSVEALHDVRYIEWRPTPEETKDVEWLLHGHVHEKWKRRGKMINVGVDQWDFAPVSLEQLVQFARS